MNSEQETITGNVYEMLASTAPIAVLSVPALTLVFLYGVGLYTLSGQPSEIEPLWNLVLSGAGTLAFVWVYASLFGGVVITGVKRWQSDG